MAQVTADDTRSRTDRRPARTAALLVLAVVIAVLVAAAIVAGSGSRPLVALGLPDPGELTTVGLPAMRALSEVSMVLTIGALLLAAFLVPPQKSGYLDVAGFRAVRVASWTAGVWALAALLLVPLNVADALGRPVTDVLDFGLLVQLVPRLSAGTAWTLTALVALVVLAGARTVLSWGWAVVLFGLAMAGPLPVTFTGHSATGGAHDVASNSLVLHVLAAALWVGGLAAVVVLAAARGSDRAAALATAVPRFSRLALACWAVLAVTGVVNTLVRIPLWALFGSFYGLLILLKVLALLVLGGLGALHRRRTVADAAAGQAAALVRLAGVEVLLMTATIGLAVALGRSAPPDTGEGRPSRTEVVIGYDLPGPPDVGTLLFAWRFDLILGTAAVLLAVTYLLGVRRLRLRGDAWPVGRTAVWLIGCATLLVGTSSGIGAYAPAMFSVHMAQHMILAMLVPILLVLGGPVTLALRALPAAGRDGPPGPREWLLAGVHSTAARWLTHPILTLVLFVGSYYALYFSGLFALALREHWAHVAMNLHFLVVGALFFWPLIGIDPAPRRLPSAARLGIVFISVPFHAFFGIALMMDKSVIGGDFYRTLGLPWVLDPLRDQQLGGGLAWASGELPLLIVVIALLIQWSRQDERSARRADRRADSDGDAERTAYNAMLRRLAAGGSPLVADERISKNGPGHTIGSETPEDAAPEGRRGVGR